MRTEPTLDDALAWMRAGQIAPDAAALAAQRAQAEDFDYRAKAMHEAFRTPAGEIALETILRATLFRSPVDHRLATDTEYLRHAQLRQGQNQAVAMILAYLDHARDLESRHASASVPADPSDDGAGGSADGRRAAGAYASADDLAWLDGTDDGVAVTA